MNVLSPKKNPIVLFLTVSLFLSLFDLRSPGPALAVSENDASRAELLTYTRDLLNGASADIPSRSFLRSKGEWKAQLTVYDQAETVFSGEGSGPQAGESVSNAVLAGKAGGSFDAERVKKGRVLVSLEKKGKASLSLLEYQGRALELVGEDLAAVRQIDKELIREKAEAAKGYLLRSMHPEKHGFFKHYNAKKAKAEKRLRTIFTASSLWTLMKISDMDPDPEIDRNIPFIADFLLSMQVKEEGPQQGAFYYSYFLKNDTRENSFVVGTASKTIFTLLELYRKFQKGEYLDAAKNAGNWLLSMIQPDGTLVTSLRLEKDGWKKSTRFSTLYTGQVLSALSRLYGVTQDQKFLNGASRLEAVLMARAEKSGFFMQDDYRLSADPVPTSWGVMSLFDYYRVTADQKAKETILKLIDRLLARQFKDKKDLLNYGRFDGSTATSGNGWVNEVFSEVYLHGKKEGWDPKTLEKIKNSILLVTRWLIQNTYSEENTFFLKEPEKAYGGLIRNMKEETVRTDAVCHGVNGYVYMLSEWPDGPLIDIRERSAK